MSCFTYGGISDLVLTQLGKVGVTLRVDLTEDDVPDGEITHENDSRPCPSLAPSSVCGSLPHCAGDGDKALYTRFNQQIAAADQCGNRPSEPVRRNREATVEALDSRWIRSKPAPPDGRFPPPHRKGTSGRVDASRYT